MSETQLFGVTKKSNLILIGECKNSFYGARCIWQTMYEKYIPDKKYLDMDELNKVWELQNKNIDYCDKVILISTFDRFFLLKDELPEYLEMLKQFIVNNSLQQNENLNKQNSILKKVLSFNKYIGYVWNQTSINECIWQNYNFLISKNHFSIKDYRRNYESTN